MPDPFNEVDTLIKTTAYRQGTGGADTYGAALKDASQDSTFALSQFELALQTARDEIFSVCGQLENSEYDTYRLNQLKIAEIHLAKYYIYTWAGERIAVTTPDSNAAGNASTYVGPDTPSPQEKMESWYRIAEKERQKAYRLINNIGNAWDMDIGTDTTTDPYPCLAPGVYSYG